MSDSPVSFTVDISLMPSGPDLFARRALALTWLALIVSDTAAQLLFKAAAVHLAEPVPALAWIGIVARSWRVWMAVVCLLVTFGLWLVVLRTARVSRAFPVTALTFIGVVGGSWWLYGETITTLQCAGIALIVAGVAILRPLDS